VYAFNQHKFKNETWWLSSASEQKEVQDYHNIFIQPSQHKIRQNDYRILVENTLSNLKCTYITIDTLDQEKFSRDVIFSEVRLSEVQPSPVVHFRYLTENIIPQLDNITIDNNRLLVLQSRIFSHNWQAYDPDRDEIWKKMSTL
jgi:hypothetical protein